MLLWSLHIINLVYKVNFLCKCCNCIYHYYFNCVNKLAFYLNETSTPTPHNGYTTGFQHSTKHTLTDEGDHFLLDAGWVPVPGEVLWSEDVDHNGAETVLDKRDLVELLATKNYWKPKLYWKLILYNKNSSLLMLLHNFFQNGRTFYWSLTECIRSLFKKLRKKHLQSQTLSHSSLRGLFTFSVFYFNIALRLYTRLFTNSMTLQGS